MTVTLPDAWLEALADEAARRGTTVERLALEGVRRVLPEQSAVGEGGSLLDLLNGHLGSVSGTGEAFSQDCGHRFAEGLASRRSAQP